MDSTEEKFHALILGVQRNVGVSSVIQQLNATQTQDPQFYKMEFNYPQDNFLKQAKKCSLVIKESINFSLEAHQNSN